MSSRLASAAECVSGQPRLHGKILFRKKKFKERGNWFVLKSQSITPDLSLLFWSG